MFKKCLVAQALVLAFAISAGGTEANLPKVKPDQPLPANIYVELAKAVNPAVVNIFTTYMPQGRSQRMSPNRDPLFDMLEQFYGGGSGPVRPQQSLGSGFIIREDGLIVTNNHVVDRADVIKVQISENVKEVFDAKVVGKDARTDIALIKIEAKRKLPFVKMGSSANAQVGEWVATFGNPLGYGHTMNHGIISALGREIEELNLIPFMQTDALINPGNSGGPLVNMQGEVIGVNAAIDARGPGIGFVIPIDNVKLLLPQLEKDGKIQRAFFGVQMNDIDAEGAGMLNMKQTEGALITQVVPGTSADKAGILAYDLVVEFGGTKITNTRDLNKAVANATVGKEVVVKVIRNNKPKSINVTMIMKPDLQTAMTAHNRKSGESGNTGTEAPFNMGFLMADYNPSIAQEFNLPRLKDQRPVVVAVDPSGPAGRSGLAPGDIILDVNRNPTSKAKDAAKFLKRGTINILRILKQDRVVLISVRAN